MENFGITNYLAFLLAGIVLNITPGQDTMYILARTLGQGRSAGVMAALGISSGTVFHTLAAACGLYVLLANAPGVFTVVKWAGAAYLVYQGVKSICGTGALSMNGSKKKPTSLKKMYISGLLTNILNPKVGLFFVAFLPQFIVPGEGTFLSFLFLGSTFIFTGTLWCLCLVFLCQQIDQHYYPKRQCLNLAWQVVWLCFYCSWSKPSF